jgi:hypothetical protein
MKNKLTLKNLQILEKLNSDGRFISTPEPSEIDEVRYEISCMFYLCDWLVWSFMNNKISTEKAIEMAAYLTTLPTVKDYLKSISNNIFDLILKHNIENIK